MQPEPGKYQRRERWGTVPPAHRCGDGPGAHSHRPFLGARKSPFTSLPAGMRTRPSVTAKDSESSARTDRLAAGTNCEQPPHVVKEPRGSCLPPAARSPGTDSRALADSARGLKAALRSPGGLRLQAETRISGEERNRLKLEVTIPCLMLFRGACSSFRTLTVVTEAVIFQQQR